MEFFKALFASGGFQPHGFCYQWNSGLVWLNVLSDTLIALSYFAIPIILLRFIRKRKDLPFSWMFALFGVFIVACGTTHLMEVWNLWHAQYWLAGAIKALTAAASISTATLLVRVVPQAIALPSEQQWIQANAALEKEVHERRELEFDLRSSEAKYRDTAELLDLTQDAIFVRNMKDEIVFWNRAAERLYGWRKEELRGRTSHDVLQTVFPKRPEEIESEVLEKGSWEGELVHRNQDGDSLIVFSRWALKADASGKPIAVLESNRDITNSKRDERKFRDLLDGAPDAVVIVNEKGCIELANTQMENTFGYTKAELLGKSVDMLLPERYRGKHAGHQQKYFQAPKNRGMGEGLELFGLRKNGEEFPVEISLSPLETSEGTLVSSAIRDISERKRTADALKASEERLQMAVEAAQFGVWDLDLTSDRAFRSLRHDQIFGYESLQPEWGSEIAERHIVPEDRERFRSSFGEALRTNNFFMECRINRTADHSLRWVCAQGRVYRDPSGKPLRMMGVVSDTTDRKQSEQELVRHQQELSHSNSELAAANKELEAFSYSVSHDLRAPLRSIDGFSLALLEDYSEKLDDEGKKHLQRVRAATQRMGELIDDILNLSRVTRASMRLERVSVSDVAAEVSAKLQESQPERRVEVHIAKGLEVNADSRLLKILLENLLGNAWKFTSKRASAHIELGKTNENGTSAFFVRDDGAGFDPAYADRLFGAFQRLHAMSEFPGTGIGLATVQRIVHRHGGRVWAESSVGQGATFYFTLAGASS